MNTDPLPARLSQQEWARLTWHGATERLLNTIAEPAGDTSDCAEPVGGPGRFVHRVLLALAESFGLFN